MLYSKYSPHSDSSFNYVEYTNKIFSKSVADRDTITKSFNKQENSWKKELKSFQTKTNKFYRLVSKAIKNSDLKRIARKTEDSSDSNSHSSG